MIGRQVVLVVEDEPMIGRILEHKLRREGHQVLWARTAAEADSAVRGGAVDLALVDVTLERDGIEMARAWRPPGTPRAGWLALTEARDEQSRRRALEAGAAGVVDKPFKPTAVARTVSELLGEQDR